MERKLIFMGVWLERKGKMKNWCGPGVFSLDPPKFYLPNLGEKKGEMNSCSQWKKYFPLPFMWTTCCFFTLSFLFFSFLAFIGVDFFTFFFLGCEAFSHLILFFFFFFCAFVFLGVRVIFFLIIFFLGLIRHDFFIYVFFSRHIFLF